MQDRCPVCMEHTICSKINLDKPDGTVDAPDGTTRGSVIWNLASVQVKARFGMFPIVLLGEEAQVKARFGLFGDSANFDDR